MVFRQESKHIPGKDQSADHGTDHAQKNHHCKHGLYDAEGGIPAPKHSFQPLPI